MTENAWSNYDIHHFIRFRTNVRPISLPSYFRVDAVDPDLELRLVPNLEPPDAVRVKRVVGYTAYELGDEELFYECDVPVMDLVRTGARWKFHLEGVARDRTRIRTAVPFYRFQPVRFRVTQLLSKLTNLLLTIKLIRRGLAMCHATTVATDGRACMLFGYSGTGKSSLASMLIDAGYEFMSDDFALVQADGTVLAYPDFRRPRPLRPSPLSKYLFRTRPYMREGMRVRDRAQIDTMFFLERGSDDVSEMEPDEALRRVLLLNTEELSKMWNSPITVLLNHYAYFYPELDFTDITERYRASVAGFVARARRFVNVRSNSPTFDVLREVLLREVAR